MFVQLRTVIGFLAVVLLLVGGACGDPETTGGTDDEQHDQDEHTGQDDPGDDDQDPDDDCEPATCDELGLNCGEVPDGCGDVIDCGSCSSGQTCGAEQPNVCGEGTCEPTTCEAENAECGQISDGCGSTIDCGGCSPGQQCGGDEPNVCVSTGDCDPGCPPGFECDDDICVGGDPADLQIDLKHITVSGEITFEGAVPEDGPLCDSDPDADAAVVRFEDTRHYRNYEYAIPCGSNDFSFELDLWPSTYDVRVRSTVEDDEAGADFALEDPDGEPFSWGWQWTTVEHDIELKEDAELDFDLEHVTVSGEVTFEGTTPAGGPGCDSVFDRDAAQVRFDDLSEDAVRSQYDFYIPCDSDDFSFELDLWPASYDVRVKTLVYMDGPGTDFALQGPDGEPIFDENRQAMYVERDLVVDDDAEVNLDLEHITVSGEVTFEDSPAEHGPACDTNSDRYSAHLLFENIAHDEDAEHWVHFPCDSDDFSFELDLWPSSYEVRIHSTVYDDEAGANFALEDPGGETYEEERQRFYVDRNLVIDDDTELEIAPKHATVSGLILYEGTTPVDGAKCSGDDRNSAIVELDDLDYYPGTYSVEIPCDSAYTFEIDVWPGNYDVGLRSTIYLGDAGANFALIRPDGSPRTEGEQWFYPEHDLTIDGDTSLDFDLEHITVSGEVTFEGETPEAGPGCDDPYASRTAELQFYGQSGTSVRYNYSFYCDSDDYTYEMDLWPGTYDVQIRPIMYNGDPGVNFALSRYYDYPYRSGKQWYHHRHDYLIDTDTQMDVDIEHITVSGNLTFEGDVPDDAVSCDWDNYASTILEFQNNYLPDWYHTYDYPIPCGSDYSFEFDLWPANYDISVRPRSKTSPGDDDMALHDQFDEVYEDHEAWEHPVEGILLQ